MSEPAQTSLATSRAGAGRAAVVAQLRRHPVAVTALGLVIAYAVIVPELRDAGTTNFLQALREPSGEHPFGTDHFGFDLFTRTAEGLRLSLLIGAICAVTATALGMGVGLLAAVRGGWVDRVLMRATDAINSIPHLILGVVIVSLFRGSIPALVLSIALTHWPQVARVVRATVLAVRESDYVAASYGAGGGRAWVLRHHLAPAATGQAIVAVVLLLPHAVWHESALSFLGLGLQPDQPSLGTLMDQARADIMMGAWWTLAFPAVALLTATMAIITLAPHEGARPRNRAGRRADRRASRPTGRADLAVGGAA